MRKSQSGLFVSITVLLLLFSGCSANQKDTVSQRDAGAQAPEVVKAIDFDEVQWYAKRASTAYNTEAEIRAAFPDTVRVSQVGNTQVQYFLELDDENKVQVISVRGTANLKNIKEDVEYTQSKNKDLDIYVHRGFDEDAYKIYNDILPHLRKDYSVRLTGHSLGAAIAAILMIYLHEDGFEVQKMINFGQPKFTNKKGVQRYHTLPLTRIVNENDIVPLLPPATLLSAIHGIYEHMGDEAILLKGTAYVYLEQHQADTQKVEGFWDNIDHESVQEHFIANYLKNIGSKLKTALQVPFADREVYLDQHDD
ncbi:MAG: lipase family protein [Burkholderiales bacterium]|nr:lipase family protein [Nitrosomonas sp.]MCP5275694.1 lipase family protein [Burkholderiales bacterium]